MKKLRVITIFIVLLALFSICTINIYAEETLDASKLVVIVDDDYRYYDLGGMTNVEWSDYISYYNGYHEVSPFAILGDYVIYENSYLTCRGTLVCSSDLVTNSTGVGYYLGDSIYTVTDDTITFSTNIPETMLFSELISILSSTNSDNLLTSGGYYGTNYVHYNSRQLCNNDAFIKINHNVGSGLVYLLSELCEHDWYLETVIEANTCISDGSGEFRCRRCNKTEVQIIALDVNAHNYKVLEEISSTCTTKGYIKEQCELCNDINEVYINSLGHNYSDPTCTEDGKCIRCGAKGESALGHNMFLNMFCMRDGCNYNTGAKYGEELGTGLNNLGQAIVNVFSDGAEKVEEATTIIYEYIFPGEDGKGLGANSGLTGNEDPNVPSWKEILNIAKWVLFIIPIIFVAYLVIKYSIKIRNVVEKNKIKKGRRREKKK